VNNISILKIQVVVPTTLISYLGLFTYNPPVYS